MTELSYGQKAVGLSFNPSGDSEVARCKQMFADAIDQLNDFNNVPLSIEHTALIQEAIRQAQTAQMWAVKAITWRG